MKISMREQERALRLSSLQVTAKVKEVGTEVGIKAGLTRVGDSNDGGEWE